MWENQKTLIKIRNIHAKIVVSKEMVVLVTSIDVLLQEVFLLHGIMKIIGVVRSAGVKNIGCPEKIGGNTSKMVRCGSNVHK
jgi:hypothetical protein